MRPLWTILRGGGALAIACRAAVATDSDIVMKRNHGRRRLERSTSAPVGRQVTGRPPRARASPASWRT